MLCTFVYEQITAFNTILNSPFSKMAVKVWVAVVFLLVGLAYAAEDRSGWIDPNDMLNFDPSTNTMHNKGKKLKISVQSPKKSEKEVADESVIITSTAQTPAQEKPVQHVPDCSPCPELSCPACPEQLSHPGVCEGCPASQGSSPHPTDGTCDRASLPLLRQYVRELKKHLGDKMPESGRGDFTMHISLSASQMSILNRFIDEGQQKHVSDVHEILNNMVERVATSHLGPMGKSMLYIEDKLGIKWDRVVQMFQLASLASFVLFLEVKLQIPWRRRISQLIVLMFFISIPWTWIELYKKEEIKHQTLLQKNMPSECSGGDDYWTAFKSYLTLQDDKCQDYYEHLLIDPVFKIPPTKAIGITFVRFFVAPLKDVGTAMSEFIRALLIDLPLTLYPVAIAMVSIFLFLFLFMWFGYSIRLPFFITIEKSPQLTVAEGHLQQAIQDSTEQTRKQLEQMQALLAATETQINEKLDNMEKVQKLAIEYNQSSDSPERFQSPSLSSDFLNSNSYPSAPLSNHFDNVKSKSPTKSPVKPPRASKSSPTKIPSASKVQDVIRSPKNNMGDMNLPSASHPKTRLLRSGDSMQGEGQDEVDGVDVYDVTGCVAQDPENVGTRQT